MLLADQTRPHPFWPSRAPFEHRLQARAHHDHRVLDARQALRPVHLESFGVDVLPLVPGLTDRLAEGIDVMDAGCDSGRALSLLARKFPNSRFVGYDFSEEAISRARVEAEERAAPGTSASGSGMSRTSARRINTTS